MMLLILAALGLQPVQAQSPIESMLTEEEIKSLRDPFRASESAQKMVEASKKPELESFSVSEMALNGLIAGVKSPKAMITLPNSKTFFIKVGDKLGVRDGRVVSISGDTVKVVEYEKDEKGKLVPEYVNLTIAGKSANEDTDKEQQ